MTRELLVSEQLKWDVFSYIKGITSERFQRKTEAPETRKVLHVTNISTEHLPSPWSTDAKLKKKY